MGANKPTRSVCYSYFRRNRQVSRVKALLKALLQISPLTREQFRVARVRARMIAREDRRVLLFQIQVVPVDRLFLRAGVGLIIDAVVRDPWDHHKFLDARGARIRQ